MKTIDKIPVSKISRAGKLIKTGLKVGSNQIRYYGEKLTNPDQAKKNLDQNNAEDIYNSLSQLKGSSLKVAQMLSMDKNILPEAYVDKFSLAQFSVPPLSAPLVKKTFKKYFGQTPEELFDQFETNSTYAASIGQVHRAMKSGKKLAVKIQYPGVAESVSSDLALVKPFAIRMLNLKGQDIDKYFHEVESKLLEETDYKLEVKRSIAITKACGKIPGLKFPNYYDSLSNERVITMDWMTGVHLSDFTKRNLNQQAADRLGQTLWDFYMYQIHGLKQVHADPHPGNFLVDESHNLIAIDFGCIKEIPDEFYVPYFELADQKTMDDASLFEQKLYDLEILKLDDSDEERRFFTSFFKELLRLFTLPFNQEVFNFDNDDFFNAIAEKGQQLSKSPELKKMNQNRGSKHFIYMNRTFFGLYNLLYSLKSKIETNHYKKYI